MHAPTILILVLTLFSAAIYMVVAVGVLGLTDARLSVVPAVACVVVVDCAEFTVCLVKAPLRRCLGVCRGGRKHLVLVWGYGGLVVDELCRGNAGKC